MQLLMPIYAVLCSELNVSDLFVVPKRVAHIISQTVPENHNFQSLQTWKIFKIALFCSLSEAHACHKVLRRQNYGYSKSSDLQLLL